MAKTTKSKALVPAGQRKTSVMRKAATVAVAPATDGTLLPILGSDLALAKLIGDGGDVMREGGVVLVTGRVMRPARASFPRKKYSTIRQRGPVAKGRGSVRRIRSAGAMRRVATTASCCVTRTMAIYPDMSAFPTTTHSGAGIMAQFRRTSGSRCMAV